MKLSIIIVNYNVKHYLYQCLDSVRKAIKGIDAEVFVVDNHSRDNSVTWLKPMFPEVCFIESNHNLGFSRANNRAIRKSKGEYILLLNPDTIVGEDTLRHVLTFMDEHPKAGGAGVKMLNSRGMRALESRRGIPTPMTAFYKMSGLGSKFPENKRFGRYYMSYLPWDKPVQIEIISGAFCMLRNSVLEQIGLLDEDFFMYGEDIDLSFRILKGGHENWYLPETILHYKGESTEKSSFRYVHVFYKAMFIFLKKHYGASHLWLAVPIQLAIFIKACGVLKNVMSDHIRKILGFSTTQKYKDADYFFIGSMKMIEECRKMTAKKGLSGRFYEVDQELKKEGHVQLLKEISPTHDNYIVYDTSQFTYSDILQFFERQPQDSVKIGLYHPLTKTLITDDEIIR